MFAENCSIHDGHGRNVEGLHIFKFIPYFESQVREEALRQRLPLEVLRVLKPCRVSIVVSRGAFFCVLAYYGPNDPVAFDVHVDHRPSANLSLAQAEQIGVGRIITDPPVDPLAIRFPLQLLDPSRTEIDTLLMPIVHSYLTFEMSWAKQRGLLAIPKPFFPGQHFTKTNLAFVLMPFNKDFDDVYSMCIKPCVEKHDLRCMRADEIFQPGSIIESIWQSINAALVIIADLTAKNANVFYEVGMAHTLGKEVILLTRDLDDVPFDLRHLRVIRYDWTPPGAETLAVSLNANLIAILEREYPFRRRAAP